MKTLLKQYFGYDKFRPLQKEIINYIEKLIDAGEKLDLDYLKLPGDRFEIIKKTFLKCGNEKLKPVF
ncbi:hypothetical protein KAR28_00835 [Candidatus Parcubacteria bacterium]|nr:hypothetical protein [Candidatus Parcubacteria bacterium]